MDDKSVRAQLNTQSTCYINKLYIKVVFCQFISFLSWWCMFACSQVSDRFGFNQLFDGIKGVERSRLTAESALYETKLDTVAFSFVMHSYFHM